MKSAKCRRCLMAAGWILGCIFALTKANAAFVSPYALNNFMLINTNADGTAVTPDGGLSIVLTGGNNGSGMPGTTDLVTTAQAAGLVQFKYSYFSLDIAHQDFAGYFLGNAFTQIADVSGQMGTVSFMVPLGQTFGFRVGTADNQFEPGVLTLSSFSGPGASTGVPEPGGAQLLLLAGAATAACCWRRRQALRMENRA